MKLLGDTAIQREISINFCVSCWGAGNNSVAFCLGLFSFRVTIDILSRVRLMGPLVAFVVRQAWYFLHWRKSICRPHQRRGSKVIEEWTKVNSKQDAIPCKKERSRNPKREKGENEIREAHEKHSDSSEPSAWCVWEVYRHALVH